MFPEILKDSLKILKKNFNLIQLFFILYVVFSLISPLYITVKFNITAILMIILLFTLLSATMAGLFFAFKKSLNYEKNPPAKKNEFELSPLYFSEFLEGTGTYTFKFICAGLFSALILLLFFAVFGYVLTHYVVLPDTLLKADWSEILSNEMKLNEFFKSLSFADINKITKIAGFFFILMFTFGILTMLYPVALVEEKVNFIKSFGISLKVLFKNIFVAVVLFIFFNFLMMIFSALSVLAFNNIILAVISIFLQCWLNVLYILTLFVYYEKIR